MIRGDVLMIKEMKNDLQGAIDLARRYIPRPDSDVRTVGVSAHDIENIVKLLTHCKGLLDSAVLE